VKVQTIA